MHDGTGAASKGRILMNRAMLASVPFVALAACGGGAYPFDESGLESGELAQECAEGRAMVEELEARARSDPCLEDTLAGVPAEYSRCQSGGGSRDTSEGLGASADSMACVSAHALTIRSGPGTDYSPVGYLSQGDCVRLRGRSSDGNWAQISEGWVSVRYLDISGGFSGLSSELRDALLPQPPPPASLPPSGNCHPSYPDPGVCIPPPPPDLDCPEITFRNFTVVGSDPHGFDGDNDGVGCET